MEVNVEDHATAISPGRFANGLNPSNRYEPLDNDRPTSASLSDAASSRPASAAPLDGSEPVGRARFFFNISEHADGDRPRMRGPVCRVA